MENKKIPEWFNVKCETIIEEITPGFKCVKNAITGEVLAFMYENLDDDMLDVPDDEARINSDKPLVRLERLAEDCDDLTGEPDY